MNGDYKMLEFVVSSIANEDLNQIKIFTCYKDKNLTDPREIENLKPKIDEYILDINENNSYEVSYEALFPPKSEYFIIEFMKITDLIDVITSAKNDLSPFEYAKDEFQKQIKNKLTTIME
jgi:hypothetical protein